MYKISGGIMYKVIMYNGIMYKVIMYNGIMYKLIYSYHVQKKGAQPKPRPLLPPLFFLSVPGMQYSLYWHPNTFGKIYTLPPDQEPGKHISPVYGYW